ncbi:MAG: hypothetical protein LBM02_02045 [Lachnospiraceae bacterium]|jgi:hypothetical protein|nr:hypothetical protein [Lachnospiraceae bacterium]
MKDVLWKEKLEFKNEPRTYTGTITEVNDTGVVIQLTGRLGVLKLPWREIITSHRPDVGEKVIFKMNYVELLSDHS